jgi:hypothetical protein
MDLAVFWLPIIGTLLIGSAFAIWYGSSSRTLALWVGFAGAVSLLLTGALQLQSAIWKSQEPEPAPEVIADCFPTTLPVSSPQEGPIYAVEISTGEHNEVKINGSELFVGLPNSRIDPDFWLKMVGSVGAYRCDLTTVGNAPLFEVNLRMHFIVVEAVVKSTPGGKSATGGRTLQHIDWSLPIRKIDVSGNPYRSYFFNRTVTFIHVYLENAETSPLYGTGEKITVTPSSKLPIVLGPNLRSAH